MKVSIEALHFFPFIFLLNTSPNQKFHYADIWGFPPEEGFSSSNLHFMWLFFLLRSTQWLNQYKVPSRQWKTTRKCSIIKLNYRRALKETNKYFVTIKLCFFIAMMIENVYKHAWHSGGRRGRLREALLLNGSKLLLLIWKWLGAENQRPPSGVSRESVRQSQCSPDKQLQPGAKEEGGAQTLSKKCSSPLVWKCQGKLSDEKMKCWSPRRRGQVPRDTLQTDK